MPVLVKKQAAGHLAEMPSGPIAGTWAISLLPFLVLNQIVTVLAAHWGPGITPLSLKTAQQVFLPMNTDTIWVFLMNTIPSTLVKVKQLPTGHLWQAAAGPEMFRAQNLPG